MKKHIKTIINLTLILFMFSTFFVVKTWADEDDNSTEGTEEETVLVDETKDESDDESGDLDNDAVFEEDKDDKKEDDNSGDYTPAEGDSNQEKDKKTEDDNLSDENLKDNDTVDKDKEETSKGNNFRSLSKSNNENQLRNGNTNNETGYITFSSDEPFTVALSNKTWPETIEYSTDLLSWKKYDTVDEKIACNDVPTSVNYNKLFFRGTGNTYISTSTDNYSSFKINSPSENKVSCSGNIEALLDYDAVTEGQHPQMDAYAFYRLFENCSSLETAPNLPAETLAHHCYSFMFYKCTSLTAAPALPATTLVDHCYSDMFDGCSSLTAAPALPATTLADYCYSYMFELCTSLTAAPELSATTLATGCYSFMFFCCRSLTTIPALPAETLATDCYSYMFSGCTSLETAPALPATTLADNCYSYMFYGCTSLKLSETKENGYNIPYRIPSSGTGTEALGSLTSMFKDTGGEFKGTPDINTTYYLYGEEPVLERSYITFSSDEPFKILLTKKTWSDTGTIEYSTDLSTWSVYTTAGTEVVSSADQASVHRIYFSGTGNTYISQSENNYCSFRIIPLSENTVSCSGNIESLLDYGTVSSGKHPKMDSYAFYRLFASCTSLTSAPELPAETLSYHCYEYMFNNCTSLTKAPELPAQSLLFHCYDSMFRYCTSLVTAPALPATDLASNCYESMFENCTSLTSAPKLPAETLASYCYYSMFRDCKSLAKAPELPATTAAYACYQLMFYNCTSLIKAPELPATTLKDMCYYNMFSGCKSLTTVPKLSATTMIEHCYNSMFSGCEKILISETKGNGYNNPYRVPNEGTGTDAYYALNNMFAGTGGTFKGTPELNKTYYLYGEEPAPEGSFITFSSPESFTVKLGTENKKTWDGKVYYSIDKANWNEYSPGTIVEPNDDNEVYFRGKDNTQFAKGYISPNEDENEYSSFVLSGSNISCSGNIETLLDFEDVIEGNHPTAKSETFYSLFNECTSLVSAPELPLTELKTNSYRRMFAGCTSLTSAPALPATTLANHCYESMFEDCTSLVAAPALPATTLAIHCYSQMFAGCTSLSEAPVLPATELLDKYDIISVGCYLGMFKGCTSLETAPALPATTLASFCYESMFEDCTSLLTAPALPATTLENSCYYRMFYGCTSLETAPALPATTLASSCYSSMFEGCTSLTSAPALPATTLADHCYSSMFTDCTSLTTPSALPATELKPYCYTSMFSHCENIKLSETSDNGYHIPYRIPVSGTGTGEEEPMSLSGMFALTGGTFGGIYDDGTPELNKTYYLYDGVFSLYFDINYDGGTNPESRTKTYGETLGTLPSVSREGYFFDGWWNRLSGGRRYLETDTYPATKDWTLIARWVENLVGKEYKVDKTDILKAPDYYNTYYIFGDAKYQISKNRKYTLNIDKYDTNNNRCYLEFYFTNGTYHFRLGPVTYDPSKIITGVKITSGSGPTDDPYVFELVYTEKEKINPTVTIEGWKYGEEPNDPVIEGNTGQGTVKEEYKTKDSDDSTYSTDIPENAGNYTLRVTIAETSDYKGAEVTVDFSIAKADPSVTVPSAKTDLEYTGSAQELITAGSAEGGTMYYCIGQDSTTPTAYGTEVPKATDAGTYYVFYHVKGDDNHNNTEAQVLEAKIAKADPSGLFPEGYHLIAELGDKLGDVLLPEGWSWINEEQSVGQEGTHYFLAKYTGDSTNYKDVPVNIPVIVIKGTYSYVSGSSSCVWIKGSLGSLLFTFKRTINDKKTFDSFLSAYTDGKEMTQNAQYGIKQGSLIISLNDSILNSLSIGTHILKVKFIDGEATITFKVIDKSSGGGSSSKEYEPPKTGIE